MNNLTAAQIAALTALREARRAAAGTTRQKFFTAEEIGGASGSALAALVRKRLVEHAPHTLADYVYDRAPRYGITGLGLARLGRIEREG